MNSLTKKDRFFSSSSPYFDDLFSNDLLKISDDGFSSFESTLPSANIDESDKEYSIDLAVPGLKKEDIHVELKQNILIISSEKKQEKEEKDDKKNLIRKEFNYRSFRRSFTLPESADDNKVKASYDNGILHIEVGKKLIDAPNHIKTIEVH